MIISTRLSTRTLAGYLTIDSFLAIAPTRTPEETRYLAEARAKALSDEATLMLEAREGVLHPTEKSVLSRGTRQRRANRQ